MAAPAAACGHCDEDKIAAVYDHAAVGRALELHHRVAFFAIEGAMPDAAKSRRAVLEALASAKGVDTGSARMSVEPAALGLAYDPMRTAPGDIAATVNRRLAGSHLAVSLLKVMETK